MSGGWHSGIGFVQGSCSREFLDAESSRFRVEMFSESTWGAATTVEQEIDSFGLGLQPEILRLKIRETNTQI